MTDALVKTTYQEDPDMLAWIDRTAQAISAYRGGAKVSRADVIRALTWRARQEIENQPISTVAARV